MTSALSLFLCGWCRLAVKSPLPDLYYHLRFRLCGKSRTLETGHYTRGSQMMVTRHSKETALFPLELVG